MEREQRSTSSARAGAGAGAGAGARAGARALCVLGVVSAAWLAVAAVAACLPPLASIPGEDASFESGAIRFQGCGDGIIATLDDGGDAGESCDPGAAAVQADGGVPGCTSDCRLACEGTPDPKSGHCYFVAGSDTSYEEANTRCLLARAHLVTFASVDEATLVDALSKGAAPGADTYWVGLARNSSALGGAYGSSHPEEPGFPSEPKGPCSGCFGRGAEAGVFAIDVDGGAGDCIASKIDRWLEVPCNTGGGGTTPTARTTICEREPVGARAQDCIGGFCFTLASTAGVKRYLVAVAPTDPDTAAQSCAALRGSLVVFESREEREQLAHEIRGRYPDEAEQELYIGLAPDGGAWTWDDGVVADVDAAAVRPLPWGNAQPVTSVPPAGARAYMRLATAAYDTQLSYADDGSKKPRLYICQRPAQ